EYGTLGRGVGQIIRRLRWLVQAAPDLSITFHTVLRPELSLRDVIAQLRRLKLRRLSQLLYRFWRTGALARRSYKVLRQAQKRKRLVCITHTRQDKRWLRDVHGMRDVHDHPLSYFSPLQAAEIRDRASRSQFPILASLPEGTKLIGTFGFLSPYKG